MRSHASSLFPYHSSSTLPQFSTLRKQACRKVTMAMSEPCRKTCRISAARAPFLPSCQQSCRVKGITKSTHRLSAAGDMHTCRRQQQPMMLVASLARCIRHAGQYGERRPALPHDGNKLGDAMPSRFLFCVPMRLRSLPAVLPPPLPSVASAAGGVSDV